MMFVPHSDQQTARTLRELSDARGHTSPFDVRSTSRAGFLVHEDVYEAWAGASEVEPSEPKPRRSRSREATNG